MRTESSGIRVEADLYWSTINCVERSEIGQKESFVYLSSIKELCKRAP